MLLYNCDVCDYHTNLKTNLTRHLSSKKHEKNMKKSITNDSLIHENDHNDHKMTTNDHKMTTNDHCFFECDYCSNKFSTKAHKRRHELHYCVKANEKELVKQFKNEKKLLEKNHEKEKKKMYKQIETLLEKVGDTITNNNNNTTNNNNTYNNQTNIILNNYGNEDLSHITNEMLNNLIKGPCEMINNLTKLIHFNGQKPENMNIYIPNKKQKYIKVYKNNKWLLEEKKDTIPDIVDKNYNILDSHYDNIDECGDVLNKKEKHNFRNYQEKIDSKEQKTLEYELNKCELEILNNSKNVPDAHDTHDVTIT